VEYRAAVVDRGIGGLAVPRLVPGLKTQGRNAGSGPGKFFGVRSRFILAAVSQFWGSGLALIYAWVASIGSEYFTTIGGLTIAGRECFQMDLVILGILFCGWWAA
jgi:hypothetical protein